MLKEQPGYLRLFQEEPPGRPRNRSRKSAILSKRAPEEAQSVEKAVVLDNEVPNEQRNLPEHGRPPQQHGFPEVETPVPSQRPKCPHFWRSVPSELYSPNSSSSPSRVWTPSFWYTWLTWAFAVPLAMNGADEGFRMDPAALQATVDAFNAACEAGEGDAFGRPVELDGSPNMTPIADGPFYAVRMMPVMNTTKRRPQERRPGPRHRPWTASRIPHLYEAGTLGHSAVQVYCIFGANLAECLNFGRIAGRNAAPEEPLA